MDRARSITFAGIVRENARSRANRIALVDGNVRLTYRDLKVKADHLAGGMRAQGVRSGDRVLWIGQNSCSVLELLIACSRLGATFCPANWRQSAAELVRLIEDFKPQLVVWQQGEEIADTVLRAQATVAKEYQSSWVRHDERNGLAELMSDLPYQEDEPGGDFGLLALYTAAFEGRAHAAMLSEMSIMFENLLVGRNQAIDENTVFLNSGPMFHMGTLMTTFSVLHHGGTNVIMRRPDAQEILRLIEAEGCTHAFLLTPTIEELRSIQTDENRDLTSLWRDGIPKAGPFQHIQPVVMPSHALSALRPGGYGQSETGGYITFAAAGGGGSGKAMICEIRIVDEDGVDVMDGDVGEIVVRGPVVMNGYFERDDENRLRRVNGWHHTRDLGKRLPDGGIQFVGPKVALIKSAAENIYPVEVEACLRLHASVVDVCVIGVPDPIWGQSVKAVIVKKPGSDITEDALIAHCKAHIASYKKPRFVQFVQALPRTGAGAIDRSAVATSHGAGS
jgi:long-chain acyl-CoA synthetase